MDPIERVPFLPVSLNLEGRRCLVIGPASDREAIEKHAALCESGADVRWIQDPSALRDDDVSQAFFVISTPQNAQLSARLRTLADRYRFLLCCIDQPEYGFVAMTAIAKRGPVRITVSTTGLAPRVGKLLKERLQTAMDARFERFITVLARRKMQMKDLHPGAAGSATRRADAIAAADGFDAQIAFTYPAWLDRETERDADG
jgi:siroheme synthase (precorrin-2 oxidase/ferrochelatase)